LKKISKEHGQQLCLFVNCQISEERYFIDESSNIIFNSILLGEAHIHGEVDSYEEGSKRQLLGEDLVLLDKEENEHKEDCQLKRVSNRLHIPD
jgi:hypothetical protein